MKYLISFECIKYRTRFIANDCHSNYHFSVSIIEFDENKMMSKDIMVILLSIESFICTSVGLRCRGKKTRGLG